MFYLETKTGIKLQIGLQSIKKKDDDRRAVLKNAQQALQVSEVIQGKEEAADKNQKQALKDKFLKH